MHYDTEIFLTVEQLGNHCLRASAQIKRAVKPILAPRLFAETEFMALLVRRASIAVGQAKVPIYNEVLESVAATQYMLKRAADTEYMPPSFYADSIPLTVSIGKQAISLRNKFAAPPQ